MKTLTLFPLLLALAASASTTLAQSPSATGRAPFSAGASVAPTLESPTVISPAPAPEPAGSAAKAIPGVLPLPSPGPAATTATTVPSAPAPNPAVPAAKAIPGVLPLPSPGGAATTASSTPPPPNGGILLNFQGASLNDVLTYLSETAGFVIVQEAPVQGTVNLVSRQPLTPEEAVDTLNSVLIDKGYTAVRNGRVLKVIRSSLALKHPDTLVISGNKAEQIPRKDNIVTQIIPIRFGEAGKLVENLRPLLADTASITSNDSSNAILLTDTQTNIRRIVQIVQALDTSVANISTITVFPLKFADSKEVATMITQLFATPTQNQQGGQGGRRGGGGGPGGGGFGGFGGFNFGGGPGGPGGGGGNQAAQSEARTAASKVVAVADEQSNSVIVSCPEDMVPTIREMIIQIDTSITDVTDTRIFRLQNADATELATIITNLYADSPATGQNNQQRNGRGGAGGGFPGFPFGGGQQSTAANQSSRALKQGKVTAVGDPRTNSLLVTAAQDSMANIAELIGRLDATTAKKQHIYTHLVQYGDPNNLANVLRGMLGQSVTTQQIDRLNDRQNTGAAINTDLSSSSGLGGGGNSGR